MSSLLRTIVLVTQRDLVTASSLRELLPADTYHVSAVKTAQAAKQYFLASGLPDLVIVDLGLPGRTGRRLCMQLSQWASSLIIALSGKDESTDAAANALRYADDFVRSSLLDAEELAMRCQRMLGRVPARGPGEGPNMRIADGLTVNYIDRVVTLKGEAVKLTPVENAILNVLFRYRGKTVDASMLVDRVWRLSANTMERNALRVHIHRLRHKLGDVLQNPRIIVSERGIGYRLMST